MLPHKAKKRRRIKSSLHKRQQPSVKRLRATRIARDKVLAGSELNDKEAVLYQDWKARTLTKIEREEVLPTQEALLNKCLAAEAA